MGLRKTATFNSLDGPALPNWFTDLPFRDQREIMERPFFSLGKRPRMEPIEYEVGGVYVKVNPGKNRGLATIWDADVIIWATTQVSMNILVSESATDQELTSLLGQLLQDTSRRTDFRYHEHPTVIGIWAYASREHEESGMGQWEAMVAKTPRDPEPSVQIRLGRGTPEEPENRFGLTRAEGRRPLGGVSVRRIVARLKQRANSPPISAGNSSARTNSGNSTSKPLPVNWASHATNSTKSLSRGVSRTGQCRPREDPRIGRQISN